MNNVVRCIAVYGCCYVVFCANTCTATLGGCRLGVNRVYVGLRSCRFAKERRSRHMTFCTSGARLVVLFIIRARRTANVRTAWVYGVRRTMRTLGHQPIEPNPISHLHSSRVCVQNLDSRPTRQIM